MKKADENSWLNIPYIVKNNLLPETTHQITLNHKWLSNIEKSITLTFQVQMSKSALILMSEGRFPGDQQTQDDIDLVAFFVVALKLKAYMKL